MTIRLSLPADASYASVLRTTAAAIAARCDLTYERVEDARLAIDEAFAQIIGFAEPDAPSQAMPAAGLEAEADRIRAQIEEALGPAPVAIDELIRQTGAPVAAILTVLLELELAGRCVRHPGNRVSWS